MWEVLLLMNTRDHLRSWCNSTNSAAHLPRPRAYGELIGTTAAVQDTFNRFLHLFAFWPVILRAICRHPSRTGLQRCLILTSVKTGFPSLPTLVNAKTKRLLIRADEQIHDFLKHLETRGYTENGKRKRALGLNLCLLADVQCQGR